MNDYTRLDKTLVDISKKLSDMYHPLYYFTWTPKFYLNCCMVELYVELYVEFFECDMRACHKVVLDDLYKLSNKEQRATIYAIFKNLLNDLNRNIIDKIMEEKQ